jgi:hypothetical protein
MPSSVIRRHEYRRARRELLIEFVTGRIYVYLDIPEATARALETAPSKGRYFNAHIRDRYRFRELRSAHN